MVETWDALLYLQDKGYVKSIGVSNFGVRHLQYIADSGRPLPALNQIEMHPLVYKQRSALIAWCREHGVRIQAYGSLLHGYDRYLLNPPDFLLEMSSKRYPTKTTSQILLRWALQHGFLIIPKSSRYERIVENCKLYDFALTETDMDLLDEWGDSVPHHERNMYELDWGWNPIDEAPVHLGITHFWPNYEGIDINYLEEDYDHDEESYYYDEEQDEEDDEGWSDDYYNSNDIPDDHSEL